MQAVFPVTTYFAEGLPWSLLHQVAAEFLTALGVPAFQVGRTSLLHGPMLLKALWSPVVERFGSLRSWMVLTQAGIGVLVGMLAVLANTAMSNPVRDSGNLGLIWAVLMAVGVLSATHDIACDGYYMEALDERRQARYSGWRVAAFRAAMMVGSSGLVVIAGQTSWLWGFGMGAVLMLALAVFHQLFLPRLHGQEAPVVVARRTQFLDAYRSFFGQRLIGATVAFLLFYKMADVLMFSMSKVLLSRALGFGTDLRGLIGFFSVGASIVGAVVGGVWVARRGLSRTLFPITLAMVLTEPLFALMAAAAPSLSLFVGEEAATLQTINWSVSSWKFSIVGGVVMIEQFCGGLATAAQVVFIMRRCQKEHRTTHYAFATVIYSIAHIVLGYFSGYAYESAGPAGYFWGASLLALPAVVLARFAAKHLS
jgi:PAT family beta-lactamase induction signal transducer AmpG